MVFIIFSNRLLCIALQTLSFLVNVELRQWCRFEGTGQIPDAMRIPRNARISLTVTVKPISPLDVAQKIVCLTMRFITSSSKNFSNSFTADMSLYDE